MQDIKAWLQSSRDFNTGVYLYSKYGKSNFLKTLFAAGPTQFNIKKLAAELKAFAPTPPALEITLSTGGTNIIDHNELTEKPISATITDSNNNRRYFELKESQKNKYRQLERNMALIDFETKQDILHLTAKNIMQLHAAIQKIYQLIDFYDNEGVFPDQKEKKTLKTDPAQLLQSSISRTKARLKKSNCRNRTTTEKLLQIQIKQLSELRRKDE